MSIFFHTSKPIVWVELREELLFWRDFNSSCLIRCHHHFQHNTTQTYKFSLTIFTAYIHKHHITSHHMPVLIHNMKRVSVIESNKWEREWRMWKSPLSLFVFSVLNLKRNTHTLNWKFERLKQFLVFVCVVFTQQQLLRCWFGERDAVNEIESCDGFKHLLTQHFQHSSQPCQKSSPKKNNSIHTRIECDLFSLSFVCAANTPNWSKGNEVEKFLSSQPTKVNTKIKISFIL